MIPSLPGYGFSFTPGGERASIVECAAKLHALMLSLGHERYHVAGGDWGSSIAVRLAQRRIRPAHVIAWSLWRRAHQAAARHSHLKRKPQL